MIDYSSKAQYLNSLTEIEKAVGHIFREETNVKLIEILCSYALAANMDSHIRKETEIFLENLYTNDKKCQ